MFSLNKRPTRRAFIERSVLGAGSVLVAPLLLESCTDHLIPDPTKPTPNPVQVPSADGGGNWNEAAKSAIITGLSLPAEAGGLLRALTTILWPSSGEDVWAQLRDQVQTLVGKTFSDSVYDDAKGNLATLKALIDKYLVTLRTGAPTDIGDEWGRVTGYFVESQQYYTKPGYELLLLPFFTQFANLYLALLRDGVAFGQSWGRSDELHQYDITTLQGYIQGAVNNHVTGWYNSGRAILVNNTKQDDLQCEPFRTINKYERGMTLLVLDFMNTWPYFDVTKYPNGVRVVLGREIYSDPYGSCGNSPIVIRLPLPPGLTLTQLPLPINLSIWGGDRIDALELTYPYPGRIGVVIKTGRIGNQTGGTNQLPHGGNFDISPSNPITQFRVVSEPNADGVDADYVLAMQFQYHDGTTTNLFGGADLPSNYETITHGDGGLRYEVTSWLGYSNHALSSIHVNGTNDKYNTAAGIVFGFEYWQPPK